MRNKSICYWSSPVAYAVGLIVTDGNLSSDKRHITLTSTDKQLLEAFRNCLHLTNKICVNPPGGYSKKTCYKVTFGNVNFYNWLVSIGLMPNKTFKISSIDIPHKYISDFLRGHIDGDGSIIHYIDRHNSYKDKTYLYNRLYVTFRSASLSHITWLREQVKQLINIRGSLSSWTNRRKYNSDNQHTLRYCKKESLKLLKYIYYKDDIPCLDRKRDIAKYFLNKP